MELRISLADPVEIRLAVEFMGKIAVHRDQEGCFMASNAQHAAEVMAEAAVTKAAQPAGPLSREALITLASELAKKAPENRTLVKNAILAASGGHPLRECDEALLPAVQAALEAL